LEGVGCSAGIQGAIVVVEVPMPTVRLVIEGMSCGGCVKRVTEGVTRAGAVAEEVKIGEARVRVEDAGAVAKVVEALEKMGFDAKAEGAVG
jgi:copper chaperone CopZ